MPPIITYSSNHKRLLDLVITFPALIICLPFFLLIAILVRWNIGPPVFIKQKRPGKNGTPFILYKFRTMSGDTDENGKPLGDEDRITRFGKVLRNTSIDELPELWNILKGNMSLVGPRPLLMHYLNRYSPEQARRHEVKPGITGWAQVNGRNAISWEDKFRMDVWYVENLSFSLDLKIIAMTILKVLTREGVNMEGHATAEEFNPQTHSITSNGAIEITHTQRG